MGHDREGLFLFFFFFILTFHETPSCLDPRGLANDRMSWLDLWEALGFKDEGIGLVAWSLWASLLKLDINSETKSHGSFDFRTSTHMRLRGEMLRELSSVFNLVGRSREVVRQRQKALIIWPLERS